MLDSNAHMTAAAYYVPIPLLATYYTMVKNKPNSIRTYDKDGFRKRAACICVRSENEDEILLVTSSADKHRWIVPGGGLEPNEEPSSAALREVMEEAGVKGPLIRCLGSFEHLERRHRTSVYVLKVTEELSVWEDSNSRERRWFKIDEAIAELSVHKPMQCKYVDLLLTKRANDEYSAPLTSTQTPATTTTITAAATQIPAETRQSGEEKKF